MWQWPTGPGASDLPYGKDEYYTTCSDLDVVTESIQDNMTNLLLQQDPQTAAVPNFQFRTTYKPNPL